VRRHADDDEVDDDDDEEGWKGGWREIERWPAPQWVIKQAGIEKQRETEREREGGMGIYLYFLRCPRSFPLLLAGQWEAGGTGIKRIGPPTSSH
jgi:hypothetical protein